MTSALYYPEGADNGSLAKGSMFSLLILKTNEALSIHFPYNKDLDLQLCLSSNQSVNLLCIISVVR